MWCRGRDSNPHGLLHTPLKRARLPITPPRLVWIGRMAHPQLRKNFYFFGVAEAFGLAVFAFAEFAFTAAVELELLAVFAA